MNLLAGGAEIVVLKQPRSRGDVHPVQVFAVQDVDHAALAEMEIITVTGLLVAQKLEHFLLGERRKKQPELHFVIGGRPR